MKESVDRYGTGIIDMKKLTILSLSLFVFPVQLFALTTIKCDPPKGTRDSYDSSQSQKLESDKDGMSGVYPSFVYDKARPDTLIVMFPTLKEFGATHNDNATKAMVVLTTSDQITAVEQQPSEIWTYSFFPKKKVAFFTRHSALSLDGSVFSVTMFTKCKFSNN